MYAKTAGKIFGPLIGGIYIRPEFADNDGSGSAWAYSLGCLDAPTYIPLGGVAEDIFGSFREPMQLRSNRYDGFVFPAKATFKEQETYRMHRELREVKAQRDELLRENANLKTVMIAAAEEIDAHWTAHCDAEGYGPVNLQRRLEEGFPAEYGYTAGAFSRLEAQRDELLASLVALHAVARVDRDEDYAAVTKAAAAIASATGGQA